MQKIYNLKNKQGITLIALVVTIVVLLILAAVSISMLGGENDIIRQAQEAKDKTKEEGAKEQIGVEVTGSYGTDGKIDIEQLNKNLGHIEGLTYKGASLSATNKIDKLPATVELDGVKVVINGDGSTTEPITGKKYETETKINVEGTPVTIPGKFTVSGLEKESTVKDGLVIYLVPDGKTVDWNNPTEVEYAQKNYDQFVWVPVPNAILDLSSNATALSSEANIKSAVSAEITAGRYPMAIKKADGNYIGVLYQFSEEANKVKVELYSYWTPLTTSNFREPAYLEDNTYADASSYNTVGITESSLQTEFNTMVNRVNSNKGFWVGRYETSNMKGGSSLTDNSYDATQQIDVVRGATSGVSENNINWYRMYAQQKNYSKLALGSSTTATSSMIWGSQWDQIMIWMKGEKNTVNTTNGEYYVINAVGMGNYGVDATGATKTTKAVEKTGNSENYNVKNVYDLAGNVNDWSLEAYSTVFRVYHRRQLQLYV